MRRAWIYAIAVVLIGVALTLLAWSVAKDVRRMRFADPLTHPPEERLRIRLPWNDKIVHAPSPVGLPPSILDSAPYRRFVRRGAMARLEGEAENGDRIVALGGGIWRDSTGARHPLVLSVAAYRPDGTLRAETTYDPEGRPDRWTVYAADGTTATWRVTARFNVDAGTVVLREIDRFEPGRTGGRRVVVDPADPRVAVREWRIDLDGASVEILHGQSRDDAPEPDPAGEENGGVSAGPEPEEESPGVTAPANTADERPPGVTP